MTIIFYFMLVVCSPLESAVGVHVRRPIEVSLMSHPSAIHYARVRSCLAEAFYEDKLCLNNRKTSH